MKTSRELTQDGSTNEIFQEWREKATNHVEVLSPSSNRDGILMKLQVATKSFLGTVTYNTGGLLVDHGWIRIYGSGHPRLRRDIVSWNLFQNDQSTRQSQALAIADDVLGGFFALNGGAFPGDQGEVYYLAPDTLEWESLGMTYTDFINWIFFGDICKFYESLRWRNWKEDVLQIESDAGFLIYPFLWAEGEELEKRARSIVPIEELWKINQEYREKLGIV
ncbi:DUF2625 family protein [Paenibacillus aurantiacus]|uniref:DUF2625 family protein n=1 Tax=Paenibacillus aurantiacus TaxID=1936118 RepID=A0ABV5KV58_9BACL